MSIEAFDYIESAADADELLREFGREITIKRLVPGTGPAHNPGPSTATVYSAFAVVLQASKGTIEAFDNRLEGGTLIDERLRYVLMSPILTRISDEGPDTIEPASLDVVTFDGIDWTVLGCTPLKPADDPVLYPMGVKR
jgi:hypothetical protein